MQKQFVNVTVNFILYRWGRLPPIYEFEPLSISPPCWVLCSLEILTILIKNVVNEKGHLILAFVLLTMAACILTGSWSADVTWTHVVHWPNVLLRVRLAGRKPGCRGHIETAKFLITSVEFVPFWTFIQSPDKGNPSLSVCAPTNEILRPIVAYSHPGLRIL